MDFGPWILIPEHDNDASMITTYRLSSFRCATSLSTQLIPSAPIFSPSSNCPTSMSLTYSILSYAQPPWTYTCSPQPTSRCPTFFFFRLTHTNSPLPSLLPSLLFGLPSLHAHSPSLFFQMSDFSVHLPALLSFLLFILPYSPCKPAASHIPYLLNLLTYPPSFSSLRAVQPPCPPQIFTSLLQPFFACCQPLTFPLHRCSSRYKA